MGIADDNPEGGERTAPVSSGSQGPNRSEGCHLFGWLWGRLSALLGTPATAALMRRAVSAAAQSHPDLRGIVINRERLTYTSRLSDQLCADDVETSVPTYQALVREVLRLTGELTGGVMVRGLIKSEELSPWLPDVQEVEKWLTTGE